MKNTKAKTNFTINARVYRAATGKWEDIGVISSTKKWFNIRRRIKNGLSNCLNRRG